MSTLAKKLYNPVNGTVEETWEGFSWPCLFFGTLWYLDKGMWGWAIISLILAIATMGISWLCFPFYANEQYAKSLLKKGYLSYQQWEDKNKISTSITHEPELDDTKQCPACAETIKLKALKCRFCGQRFEPEEVAHLVSKRQKVGSLVNRVLCSDGNCIGVIEKDGRCNICGKYGE